jgi:hypothetical protein
VGLDAQFRDLKGAGREKIFSEQISAIGKRQQLEAAIDFIREGDTWSLPSSTGWRGQPNISWKSPNA